MKKKILLGAIIALSLALLVAVGGSIAWLISETGEVVNTFSPTDVSITLKEKIYYPNTNSYSEHPEENVTNSYPLVPGTTYHKDPVVTVLGASNAIDCYLFVKITEFANPAEYLEYDITVDDEGSGWYKLESASTDGVTVWYREVKASANDQSWHLLKDDTIIINGTTVTKESMDQAKNARLIFDAAAVQSKNLSVADAYAQVVWTTSTTPGN
jgi:hypothetical protein